MFFNKLKFRFDEILKREDVTLVPGGATQNTLRVFQVIFIIYYFDINQSI